MNPQREDSPDRLWETIERLQHEKAEMQEELDMYHAYMKVQKMIFGVDEED